MYSTSVNTSFSNLQQDNQPIRPLDILELMISDTGTLLKFLCCENNNVDILNLKMCCKVLSKAVQEGINNLYKCGLGACHFHTRISNDSISTTKRKMYELKCGNKGCTREACKSCVYICASKKCTEQRCVFCLCGDFLCCSGPKCPKQNKYYCKKCGLDVTNPRLTKECDVDGCEHRYHLKKRYQCVTYLGRKCKDCKRSYCHVHRDPKRYVDSLCRTCHLRNCSLCWGNKCCKTCPIK